jgi:hypothetical protein
MNSRNGFVSLVVVSTAFLAACSSNLPVSSQNVPYFIGGRHVTIDDPDYLPRYACANGPVVCQRTSARLGSAECRCL